MWNLVSLEKSPERTFLGGLYTFRQIEEVLKESKSKRSKEFCYYFYSFEDAFLYLRGGTLVVHASCSRIRLNFKS